MAFGASAVMTPSPQRQESLGVRRHDHLSSSLQGCRNNVAILGVVL